MCSVSGAEAGGGGGILHSEDVRVSPTPRREDAAVTGRDTSFTTSCMSMNLWLGGNNDHGHAKGQPRTSHPQNELQQSGTPRDALLLMVDAPNANHTRQSNKANRHKAAWAPEHTGHAPLVLEGRLPRGPLGILFVPVRRGGLPGTQLVQRIQSVA